MTLKDYTSNSSISRSLPPAPTGYPTATTKAGKLDSIIAIAFEILDATINKDSFRPQNEASFQLYFSNILLNVGRMIINDESETFKVDLEYQMTLSDKTSKCPDKNARCDIVCILFKDGIVVEKSFIEVKHFLKGRDCSTDNRFSVWEDIENLEHYHCDSITQTSLVACYLIVYAEEEKYSKYKRKHNFSICSDEEIFGLKSYNKKVVSLNGKYIPKWQGKILLIKIL